MKRFLLCILASLACLTAFAEDNAKRPPVTIAGVDWLRSFDEARDKAAAEHKLVLHLQMFGDLDDAYC